MTDLDQRIVRALRERAEGNVDTDRLAAGAVVRGRSRRRRRRAGAAAALGLTALLGFGATVGPGLPQAVRWPGAAPADGVAAPPRLDGTTGASVRPDLVGTDPGLLHFGVDPARAHYLTWSSARGVESARLELGAGRQVAFDLGRSATAVEQSFHEGMTYGAGSAPQATFDGSVQRVDPAGPGGQPGWFLRWQPVPGLFARLHTVADDDADLPAARAAVRLDETYRCAAPLRLTALPAGARLSGCEVNVIDFPASLDVVLTVTRPGEQRLDVRLEYARSLAGSRTEGNRTVDGRPAYLYPQGGELELLGFPKAHLTARFGWPFEGFDDADAATVLGGARVADDLTRPESWD